MSAETPNTVGSGRQWAERVAASHYGLRARARRLDGELYRNFLLETADGPRLVLKLAPGDMDPRRVELQLAALGHLHRRSEGFPCPRPVPTRADECLLRLDEGLAFALEWMPGTVMAEAGAGPNTLESIGLWTARLHEALGGFEHPGLGLHCDWDLRRALTARDKLDRVSDPEHRRRLAAVLDRYAEKVAPRFAGFEQGPIHGDLNDHNILIRHHAVAGILDFGDMSHSALVGDVAIAAAYAMFHVAKPFDAALEVVAAYHRQRALAAGEIALVPEMIAMRLAFSVIRSSWKQELCPDDPYVLVSQKPAWATLALLDSTGLDRLREQMLRRCHGR